MRGITRVYVRVHAQFRQRSVISCVPVLMVVAAMTVRECVSNVRRPHDLQFE